MIPAVEGPPGEKAVLHSECKFAFMSAKRDIFLICRRKNKKAIKSAVNVLFLRQLKRQIFRLFECPPLEGARGRNHAILQPVFFHLRPASSGPPPPAEDTQKVFIYLIAGVIKAAKTQWQHSGI